MLVVVVVVMVEVVVVDDDDSYDNDDDDDGKHQTRFKMEHTSPNRPPGPGLLKREAVLALP